MYLFLRKLQQAWSSSVGHCKLKEIRFESTFECCISLKAPVLIFKKTAVAKVMSHAGEH